jgi:hypothetical protein
VRDRLRSEGRWQAPWFLIRLYLRLGEAASAEALDRDLRHQAASGPSPGLIALFGQLAPGMDMHEALSRQLRLMHSCDPQLHLLTPPSEARPTHLVLGSHRYSVMSMHEHAASLHRVMPCPMLVFSPAN